MILYAMNTNGITDMGGIHVTAYPTPQHYYLLSACCMFTNGIANMAGLLPMFFVTSYHVLTITTLTLQ